MNSVIKETLLSLVAVWLLTGRLMGGEIAVLPGTEPLRIDEDLTRLVIDGANAFMKAETRRVAVSRARFWSPDYGSAEAYERSIAENRSRFLQYIGAVDSRLPADDLEMVETVTRPALIAETDRISIYAARWPVLRGVDGEGLLIEPKGGVRAQVVALPDADWSPEMLAGLDPSVPASRQLGRRLAESGCRVLIPTLIDRSSQWSGHPEVGMLPEISHREFIYLMSYTLGRHIIGYEVQRVLGAVDYFSGRSPELPIAVAGYGEGGLIALYSAAADSRIDASLVSGYFREREDAMWREPAYRNVWGFLHEFGDSGAAALIAPRSLIIEPSRGPEGPARPQASPNIPAYASYGSLESPPPESVRTEFSRAAIPFRHLGAGGRIQLSDTTGEPFGEAAVLALLRELGIERPAPAPAEALEDKREGFDPQVRLRRQYDQLVDFSQNLIRFAPARRARFWAQGDPENPLARSIFQRHRAWTANRPYPLDKWQALTQTYRRSFWEEGIGRSPDPDLPPNPRTRMFADEPNYRGYEVVLDVWSESIHYGVLLVPKDLAPGEERPVVVVQHGLAGFPRRLADPAYTARTAYNMAGVDLANRGFIVYAPQNLYTVHDQYPFIQRRGHPLKQSFWSIMVGHHRQMLGWLRTLGFVDPDRIGFYGLSYGGKSAVYLPAVIEDYALSICSADWTERIWKNSSVLAEYTFAMRGDAPQMEFNLADRFNYAEISGLIAPRPFMVERGHYDTVSPDEWVAYEYARTRWLYHQLGIPERTEIEFFPGGHELNKQGTFRFLHRHLGWPEPQ